MILIERAAYLDYKIYQLQLPHFFNLEVGYEETNIVTLLRMKERGERETQRVSDSEMRRVRDSEGIK
jgi:hypothetical protein